MNKCSKCSNVSLTFYSTRKLWVCKKCGHSWSPTKDVEIEGTANIIVTSSALVKARHKYGENYHDDHPRRTPPPMWRV